MSIPAHVASFFRTPLTRSFFRRQFDAEPTDGQVVHDVLFGLMAPPACFLFDPGIFRGPLGAWLSGLALPVYGFAGVAMAALAAWLLLRRPVALLAVGPLFVGAVAALGVGIVLLPLSLPASFALIGFLGFVPFFSAFAYLRNAVRALRACRAAASPLVVGVALCAGVAAAAALPLGATMWARRAIERGLVAVVSNQPETRQRGVATLRRLRWFVDDDFRRAWESARGAERARLEEAYEKVRRRSLGFLVD